MRSHVSNCSIPAVAGVPDKKFVWDESLEDFLRVQNHFLSKILLSARFLRKKLKDASFDRKIFTSFFSDASEIHRAHIPERRTWQKEWTLPKDHLRLIRNRLHVAARDLAPKLLCGYECSGKFHVTFFRVGMIAFECHWTSDLPEPFRIRMS